ncbi:MAG: GNAT family N-acetyltransferase [Armatimonadetes bacterium]|nr:GNAT family N-acetyltransferase [Armatimonadota bacterium]
MPALTETTANETPTGFLRGDRVCLRPMEPKDLEHVRRWMNDPELRALTGSTFPMSRADAREWLERVRQDRDRVWLAVALAEDGRLIGEAGLLRIHYPWRTADMSLILGDKGAWGRGYGTEAARLLMDYAFGTLNLHRLSVGVVGFNERALRFWEKIGFRREGVQRDGYYLDHAYHDFVMMSILEQEFRAAG